MITGFVNAEREAVVRVAVRGPRAEEEVEAIVDTGFNGSLTLPPALVAHLGLPFLDRTRAMLADGSEIVFAVHEAEVVWSERPLIVAVGVADTDPLLGTSLLDGHRLTIEFVDGGDVSVEILPR